MVSPYSLLGAILEPSSDVEQATRHGHQSKQDAHRETEIIPAVHRYLFHQPAHGVQAHAPRSDFRHCIPFEEQPDEGRILRSAGEKSKLKGIMYMDT